MIFILYILSFIAFFLLGKAALGILYGKTREKELYWEDGFLTGGILCIGLAEAAHLAALFLHLTFADCVKIFVLLLGAALALAAVTVIWHAGRRTVPEGESREIRMGFSVWTKGERIVFALFFLLVIGQMIAIVAGRFVYMQRDMTVETVNSFLSTNTVYQVNPLTGQPYEAGMPLRLRILCLPTLYGILCKLFGLSAIQVVWTGIPFITLILCYLAYSLLARLLFADSRLKRGCFLALAALLFMAGDYAYGMDGFGLLHGGFWGVTIRGAVLLPYVISLVLRKKHKLAALCVVAEACIVWTLYGFGACIFVAAGLFVTERLIRYIKRRRNGKEEPVCGNS